jgi:hypothetical protein
VYVFANECIRLVHLKISIPLALLASGKDYLQHLYGIAGKGEILN